MYVAACCCGGPEPPVCDCRDLEIQRATVSFVFGRRDARYRYNDRCDGCPPGSVTEMSTDVFSFLTTDYVEATVPMTCQPTTDATRYVSAVSDERKCSATLLHLRNDPSSQLRRCRTPEFPFGPCPPSEKLTLGTLLDQVSLSQIEFGDTDFPDLLESASVSATTFLRRGDSFVVQFPWFEDFIGDTLDPDKYYRHTQVSLSYTPTRFVENTSRVYVDGVIDPSQGFDFSGEESSVVAPFNDAIFATVCELEDCDVAQFGLPIVTYIASPGGQVEVPFESFDETVFVPPFDCPEVPSFGQCAGLPSRPVDGEYQQTTTVISGGITGFQVES